MNENIFLILICLFAISTIGNVYSTETTVDVQKVLEKIPNNEMEMISDFFRTLIQKCGFGYTLFGKKPISIECWKTIIGYGLVSKKRQDLHILRGK